MPRSFWAMNRGTVGKLQVKTTEDWRSINDEYWTSIGVRLFTESHYSTERHWWRTKVQRYTVNFEMVKIQHKLFDAAKCNDHSMILVGGMRQWCVDDDFNYKTPFHPDILPHWGKNDISTVSYLFVPIPSLLIQTNHSTNTLQNNLLMI